MVTATQLIALQDDLSAAEAECRRLRWYVEMQREAIAALEHALRFYGAGEEPARGALAILADRRERVMRHQSRPVGGRPVAA